MRAPRYSEVESGWTVRLIIATVIVAFAILAAVLILRFAGREDTEVPSTNSTASGSAHRTEEAQPLPSDDPILRRPAHASTTDDPQALLKRWNEGKFERIRGTDILARTRRHLQIDFGCALTEAQVSALQRKLAEFLRAYSSGQFADYLRFRDQATLAGDDDPGVQDKLRSAAESWDASRGPAPATAVDLLRAGWSMYVRSDRPPIGEVDWGSCRATVRELADEQVIAQEWEQGAGTESHLYKAFQAARRASVSPGLMKTLVPSRLSAEEIAEREGRLVYADVEIIQRPTGRPGAPVIVRVVWDGAAEQWIPWNLMLLYAQHKYPLIW